MMHSISTLLLMLIGLAPASSPPNFPPPGSENPVEWLGETTVDMGDLLHHQEGIHVFKFRNQTEEALLIDNIRVGCGCTAADWADKPVAPGEVGEIKVNYDAARVGYFRKYVKVYFHGHRGAHKLWLEGFVEATE
ncbi:DUF1573 domain-containing protein [Lewinella sp. W8]|uniref:DUF1573 domain-containing protein n=1 Tax=Lewinella sp. W8 TaxID=2528208 RepID=UPI001067DD40|nr:DUF1573 domain-containing protein [Lewinella sp. W8]MTB51364.1 DUF1573 domain-containing protein [Lewinella sp. W8]